MQIVDKKVDRHGKGGAATKFWVDNWFGSRSYLDVVYYICKKLKITFYEKNDSERSVRKLF